MNVAIVGIHTGIGKTVASAIICEALQADYWKPVQAGSLEHTDTDAVQSLVSNKKSIFHKEAFRLSQPMSPHAAAKIDNTKVEIEKLKIPQTKNHLIIETAGGLMSPLNDEQTNFDFIAYFHLPVILISQNYLGSINHTLLTISALRSKGIILKGVLFNGEDNPSTQEYILGQPKLASLGRIRPLKEVTKETVAEEAKRLSSKLENAFA